MKVFAALLLIETIRLVMKHTHIFYALVALLAIALVGCEPKGPTEISVTPNENVILFPNLGESAILQLSSTADWSASIVYKGSVDGWLRVFPSSGMRAENQEITLMALKANTTIDDRRAIVTFTHAQGAQVSVEVTQAYNPNLAPRFDPKFAQVLKDQRIIASTEKILLSDVKYIRWIDVQDCGLTSLAGIEYFYALTSIQCQSNSLTSLDLSHSPELDFVECYNNKLISLDFSNNPRLRLLYCMHNRLELLNVSNCAEIIQMWCYENLLKSLDISSSTSLTSLLCDWNSCDDNYIFKVKAWFSGEPPGDFTNSPWIVVNETGEHIVNIQYVTEF